MTIGKVGLATSPSKPRPRRMPRANVVFPAPRSPLSAIMSPGWSSAPILTPNASVSSADLSVINGSPSAPRQADDHGGPLPHFRMKLDRAAMRLDELAGERQAEADRGLAVHAFGLAAVEAIEDARLVGGRNAAAIVRDDDPRLAILAVAVRVQSPGTGGTGVAGCAADSIGVAVELAAAGALVTGGVDLH